MIVNVDVYGAYHMHIDEKTGLDQDHVDRSSLLNQLQRGAYSPTQIVNVLEQDIIDEAELIVVVEVTSEEGTSSRRIILTGDAKSSLVLEKA